MELMTLIALPEVRLALSFAGGLLLLGLITVPAILLIVSAVRRPAPVEPETEKRFEHEHDPRALDSIPENIRMRYRLLSKAMEDENMSKIIEHQTVLCRSRWFVPVTRSEVAQILGKHVGGR